MKIVKKKNLHFSPVPLRLSVKSLILISNISPVRARERPSICNKASSEGKPSGDKFQDSQEKHASNTKSKYEERKNGTSTTAMHPKRRLPETGNKLPFHDAFTSKQQRRSSYFYLLDILLLSSSPLAFLLSFSR